MTSVGGEVEEVQPRTLGRYTLVRLRGRGGMGEVWEARDAELGRDVALKLLHPESAERARDRLRREAQAMASLRHPNITAVHDIGTVDGASFIAMELAHCTLREWLAARPRTWREILPALISTARGLAAAHRGGIVHRDVKPENVLFDSAGGVKVCDFGLAGEVEWEGGVANGGTDHRIAGTPGYMAPERLLGRPFDARADQFSFCVMSWEALGGALPFGAPRVAGVATIDLHLASVTRGAPVLGPQKVPRAIERVLRRGLAIDPAARYPDLDVLADALERARSRRWHVAIAAAVALVAVVAVTIVVLPMGRAATPGNLVVREIGASSANMFLGSVAMSRNGELVAIANGRALQMIGTDGLQRESLVLPEGLVVEVVALTEDGRGIAIGGNLDGRFEVWRTRSGDARFGRVIALPSLQRTKMQALEWPSDLAFAGDELLLLPGDGRLLAIDARGASRVIAHGTFRSVRSIPERAAFSTLDVTVGQTPQIRIYGFDGAVLATISDLPINPISYDWTRADHVVVTTYRNGQTHFFGLSVDGRGTVTKRRDLGVADVKVLTLYATATRALAITSRQSHALWIAPLGPGEPTSVNDTGLIAYPTMWRTADEVLATARVLERPAAVAVGTVAPATVLVHDASGVPVYASGDTLVLGPLDTSCDLQRYVRGRLVQTHALPCEQDPAVVCASASGPCLLAQVAGGRRTFRTLDAERLAIGEPVYSEPAAAAPMFMMMALSSDATLLAIPIPFTGVAIVELATGARRQVDVPYGMTQSATFVPGTHRLVVTSTEFEHGRIVEVGADGTLTTLRETRAGSVGMVRASPDGARVIYAEDRFSLQPVLVELGGN